MSHKAKHVFNASLFVLAVFSFGLHVVIRVIVLALAKAVFDKFRFLVFDV